MRLGIRDSQPLDSYNIKGKKNPFYTAEYRSLQVVHVASLLNKPINRIKFEIEIF